MDNASFGIKIMIIQWEKLEKRKLKAISKIQNLHNQLNKNSVFVPNSPYALFIHEKVTKYWDASKTKVKVDHKLLYLIFKVWLTLSPIQKAEYTNQFKSDLIIQ